MLPRHRIRRRSCICPQVLSPEEVARLIDAAKFPFHRILLMTLYATEGRRAEVAHLKISDIDSQRMVVHILDGKGRKDRDVMHQPPVAQVSGTPAGESLNRFGLGLSTHLR